MFSEKESLTGVESATSARLSGHSVLGICLSLPSQLWDSMCAAPCPVFVSLIKVLSVYLSVCLPACLSAGLPACVVCAYMSLCTPYACRCPQRSKDSESLGTGITCGCELPDVPGTKSQASARSHGSSSPTHSYSCVGLGLELRTSCL